MYDDGSSCSDSNLVTRSDHRLISDIESSLYYSLSFDNYKVLLGVAALGVFRIPFSFQQFAELFKSGSFRKHS